MYKQENGRINKSEQAVTGSQFCPFSGCYISILTANGLKQFFLNQVCLVSENVGLWLQ